CVVVPGLAGKEDDVRAFYEEVEARKDEYDESEQRLGITKEVAWLAAVDGGSATVVYIESGDFAQAFEAFVHSQEPFDLWFKQRVLDVSGLDLNNPPEMELPELLSVYTSKHAAVA